MDEFKNNSSILITKEHIKLEEQLNMEIIIKDELYDEDNDGMEMECTTTTTNTTKSKQMDHHLVNDKQHSNIQFEQIMIKYEKQEPLNVNVTTSKPKQHQHQHQHHATSSSSDILTQRTITSTSNQHVQPVFNKEVRRGMNFTHREIELLVDLVHPHKHIVENKFTDSNAWRGKAMAWEKITKEFNSLSGTEPRTTKGIKCKYSSLKQNLKQKAMQLKKEQSSIGDGLSDCSELEPFERKLLSICSSDIPPFFLGDDHDTVPEKRQVSTYDVEDTSASSHEPLKSQQCASPPHTSEVLPSSTGLSVEIDELSISSCSSTSSSSSCTSLDREPSTSAMSRTSPEATPKNTAALLLEDGSIIYKKKKQMMGRGNQLSEQLNSETSLTELKKQFKLQKLEKEKAQIQKYKYKIQRYKYKAKKAKLDYKLLKKYNEMAKLQNASSCSK